MNEIIEMGTVSSRGQICIPNDIREDMGLIEGSRVIFVLSNDSLIMKKISMETFAQITKPLKQEAKKMGLKEEEVNDLIHRFRKAKK